MNKKYMLFSLFLTLYSSSSLAMDVDPFQISESETNHKFSMRPMQDKELENSINQFKPKFIQPRFWQTVEVMKPHPTWIQWKNITATYVYKPVFLAHKFEGATCVFVEKWVFPTGYFFNSSLDSLVTFREDKSEVMLRRDAYEIMRYENEQLNKAREDLYELEFKKANFESIEYDGKPFGELINPSHPVVLKLLTEANSKKKEEQKRLDRIEKERIRREYEARPEVQRQRQEEEQSRLRRQKESDERDSAEKARKQKEYDDYRMRALNSGDLDRQVRAGWK